MKKLLLIAVVLFFAYRLVINSTGFCIDEMRVVTDEEICEQNFFSEVQYGKWNRQFITDIQLVKEHLRQNPGACIIKRNIRVLSSYPHYIEEIYKINDDETLYNYEEAETYINSCGNGLRGGERYVMSITEREAKEKSQHKISY